MDGNKITNRAKKECNEWNQPPCSLFLQWNGDSDPVEWEQPVCESEVTWAENRCWRGDSQYIRADIVREMYEAAGASMMADDPSGEDRIRLLYAWSRIGHILENEKGK